MGAAYRILWRQTSGAWVDQPGAELEPGHLGDAVAGLGLERVVGHVGGALVVVDAAVDALGIEHHGAGVEAPGLHVPGGIGFDAHVGIALAIGALLIVVAVLISIEVKAMLIGQSIEPQSRRNLLDFLDQRPEIEKVYNLLTLQLGNDVLVSV